MLGSDSLKDDDNAKHLIEGLFLSRRLVSCYGTSSFCTYKLSLITGREGHKKGAALPVR